MDWALPTWWPGLDRAERDQRFEGVYRATAGLVRSAVFLIGGEQDLDDVVQETFVKVWKSLHRFEGRSDLKTWVYRIAVNTARSHWRSAARRKEKTASYLPETPVAPVDVETNELVRRGLLAIPIEQREVIVLYYYEELSLAEIAQVVKTKEGTVKSRLHYGRKALEAWLKARGGLT